MELKEFSRNKYLRARTTAPYHVPSSRSLGASISVSAAAWYQELKSGPGWSRLLAQRGAQLAVIALLAALAIDCALILTRALSQISVPSPAAGSARAAPPRAPVNPTLELATVVNAHLFGMSGVQAGGSAPQTTMPLILAGVIADKDPAKGQAIIGDSAAAAKLFAVGAMISGGARLSSVYGDRVLLERNGRLETLMLPHTPAKGGAGSMAPPPATRSNALQDNATVLAGLVRVQPVFNQGKLSGYRIFPGGSHGASAFTQLGLRAGDLIVAVNGTALDDAGRAMEVMQTLSSSASATVTVSRNGQPQEVNLNLATLSNDLEAPAAENAAGAGGGEAPANGGSAPPGGSAGLGPMRSGRLSGPAPPVPPAAGTALPVDAPPAAPPAANSAGSER
jgi:general secretion pathway protein C